MSKASDSEMDLLECDTGSLDGDGSPLELREIFGNNETPNSDVASETIGGNLTRIRMPTATLLSETSEENAQRVRGPNKRRRTPTSSS